MGRPTVEKVIRRVEELPTLPVVITRILEVLEDERSSARDREKVVSRDQSIAARVPRIANSAYYGCSRRITTLPRAILILGFETVKGLALGSPIFETFLRTGPISDFDRTVYWLHSIACA
jgi:HD-like signal output (HDOD) protein